MKKAAGVDNQLNISIIQSIEHLVVEFGIPEVLPSTISRAQPFKLRPHIFVLHKKTCELPRPYIIRISVGPQAFFKPHIINDIDDTCSHQAIIKQFHAITEI